MLWAIAVRLPLIPKSGRKVLVSMEVESVCHRSDISVRCYMNAFCEDITGDHGMVAPRKNTRNVKSCCFVLNYCRLFHLCVFVILKQKFCSLYMTLHEKSNVNFLFTSNTLINKCIHMFFSVHYFQCQCFSRTK